MANLDYASALKLKEVYNTLFPQGTIPDNSIVYMNDISGFKQLAKDHDVSIEDIINETSDELYSKNDIYMNYCYPEGIVSFNEDSLVESMHTDICKENATVKLIYAEHKE